MSGVTDVVMLLILLGGGYYLWSSGELNKLLQGTGLPQIPGPGGGAAPPSGAGAPGGGTATLGSGDCAKTIYQATGKVQDNSKKTKDGTRHYASGKSDDVTKEWSTSVNFKNYEFTAYMTITKIDHDDTASMKFGGTHMGSGWYDNGVGFNSGQFCMGKEENHPSTDLCVVKCKSIGSIVNKKFGMKCIIFNAGTGQAQLEMWGDPAANGQWQQMCPRQNGIGGFYPNSPKQETAIRIDAAPGVTMHCSAIQEITGPTRAGGGGRMPGVPPNQPVAPKSNVEGQSPQSGGGEPGEGDSGGGKEDKESNYASFRVSYY